MLIITITGNVNNLVSLCMCVVFCNDKLVFLLITECFPIFVVIKLLKSNKHPSATVKSTENRGEKSEIQPSGLQMIATRENDSPSQTIINEKTNQNDSISRDIHTDEDTSGSDGTHSKNGNGDSQDEIENESSED